MDRYIQMCADDVLHAPSGITECLFDFTVDIIPKSATTASQIPVKRSEDISKVLIAWFFVISLLLSRYRQSGQAVIVRTIVILDDLSVVSHFRAECRS